MTIHMQSIVEVKKEILNNHGENRSLIPNSSECRIYALEQVKENNSLIVPKVPFFSISLLLYCIFYILYEVRLTTQRLQD